MVGNLQGHVGMVRPCALALRRIKTHMSRKLLRLRCSPLSSLQTFWLLGSSCRANFLLVSGLRHRKAPRAEGIPFPRIKQKGYPCPVFYLLVFSKESWSIFCRDYTGIHGPYQEPVRLPCYVARAAALSGFQEGARVRHSQGSAEDYSLSQVDRIWFRVWCSGFRVLGFSPP